MTTFTLDFTLSWRLPFFLPVIETRVEVTDDEPETPQEDKQ